MVHKTLWEGAPEGVISYTGVIRSPDVIPTLILNFLLLNLITTDFIQSAIWGLI